MIYSYINRYSDFLFVPSNNSRKAALNLQLPTYLFHISSLNSYSKGAFAYKYPRTRVRFRHSTHSTTWYCSFFCFFFFRVKKAFFVGNSSTYLFHAFFVLLFHSWVQLMCILVCTYEGDMIILNNLRFHLSTHLFSCFIRLERFKNMFLLEGFLFIPKNYETGVDFVQLQTRICIALRSPVLMRCLHTFFEFTNNFNFTHLMPMY